MVARAPLLDGVALALEPVAPQQRLERAALRGPRDVVRVIHEEERGERGLGARVRPGLGLEVGGEAVEQARHGRRQPLARLVATAAALRSAARASAAAFAAEAAVLAAGEHLRRLLVGEQPLQRAP